MKRPISFSGKRSMYFHIYYVETTLNGKKMTYPLGDPQPVERDMQPNPEKRLRLNTF